MPQITKVHFLNAARFNNSTFPVSGHTLLGGGNGVGKSTFLRALLFAYAGSPEKHILGLNASQMQFVPYYVGSVPSYLVYEVEREEDQSSFHFLITRPENHIRFLFIDAPFDIELYLDENRAYLHFNAFLNGLKARSIEHYGPFSDYGEYKSIIYGNSPKQRRYSLFQPKRRTRDNNPVERLPNFISSIFRIGKLDSNKLKLAFTSGLESESIDLEKWKAWISESQSQIRNIRLFEKTLPTAERLIENLATHEEYKRRINSLSMQFALHARTLEPAKSKQDEIVSLLTKQIHDLDTIHKAEDRTLVERIAVLKNEIGNFEKSIKDAEERHAKYEAEKIQEKIAEYETLPTKRLQLQELEAKIKILKEEQGNIHDQFDKLADELDKSTKEQIQTLSEEANKCLQHQILEQDVLKTKRRTQLQEYDKETENLLKSPNEDLGRIKQAHKNLKHEMLEGNALSSISNEQKEIQARIDRGKKIRAEESNKLQQKNNELSLLSKSHKIDFKVLQDEQAKDVQSIDLEIEGHKGKINKLTDRLENLEASVAGFIRGRCPRYWK